MPATELNSNGILREGRNCWRVARAGRAAFLIDSETYFAAFAEAVEQAVHQVFILAWDIDSRVELVRGDRKGHLPSRLGDLLWYLLKKKPHLHIYVLCWDFALVYAFEREFFSLYKLSWAHRRFHFRYDGRHPVGASHHQKVIVIDDKVAFAGGIDLAKRRWDRPEHKTVDPLRVDVEGKLYPPTHDVQMLVDGPAAAVLGELARERWRRRTGHRVEAPFMGAGDPWPESVTPDLQNVDMGISRTEPTYGKCLEVREIEKLHLDAIASARRFIYIENQYITSTLIGKTIAERLQEKDGPEFVLIIPERTSGWLSESTMDVCRTRLLKQLRTKDIHGHLRMYYPVVPGLEKGYVEVHSKVLVVDDSLVRIGSSNLCDRSFGLDTECDLTVEANGDTRIREAIGGFRDRLLGQHLNVPPREVSELVEVEGSLIAAVDKLRGEGHTLVPFDREVSEWLDKLMPDGVILDPAHPIEPRELVEVMIPREDAKKSYLNLLGLFASLLAMVVLVGMWRWSPLGELVNTQTIVQEANALKGNPLMPLFVYTFYVVGGLIFFPVMAMIIATAIFFDPVSGFFYSLTGCLLSSSAGYFVGRVLRRNIFRLMSGKRSRRLNERLSRKDLATLFALRVIPIAPFTAVNMFAGAKHISFSLFLVTTFLGMFPGIFAITIFGHSLWTIIREPTPEGFAFLTASAVLIILIFLALWKLIARYETATDQLQQSERGEK